MLIKRIQDGDPTAFEELTRKYYQNIFSFCVRRCNGNRLLAADMTQETFLKLVEHIQRYRPTGKFINFLLTIAVNTCNNSFKKKAPELLDIEAAAQLPAKEDMEGQFLQKEAGWTIQQAIDRLPDSQKETIILRFYHDRKLREIAVITGVSLSTAKSRLRQGLDKLKHYLNEEEF